MADYYHGSLSIPAKFLTNENMKLLDEMAEEDELKLSDLEEDTPSKGIRHFSHHETRDGKFEDLESNLVQLGIPFDRYSSGHYEFQPERRYFRPGECDREIVESEHDGEYIPHDRIKELLSVILDEEKGREDAVAVATKLVQEYTSEGIPPLENYVGDEANE